MASPAALVCASANGRTIFAAVYPELRAGDYEVVCPGSPRFTITAGAVAEVTLDGPPLT